MGYFSCFLPFQLNLDKQDAVKNDTGTYKCISKAPDGPYVMMKTELEVIDVSYLPEVDDWEVCTSNIHLKNTESTNIY